MIKLENEVPNFFLFNEVEDFQAKYNVGSKLEGSATRNEKLGTFVIEYLKQSSTKKEVRGGHVIRTRDWKKEEEIEKKWLSYVDQEISIHPEISPQEIETTREKMQEKIQKVKHIIRFDSIETCIRSLTRETLVSKFNLTSYEEFRKDYLTQGF